jgi:hypothetical protein
MTGTTERSGNPAAPARFESLLTDAVMLTVGPEDPRRAPKTAFSLMTCVSRVVQLIVLGIGSLLDAARVAPEKLVPPSLPRRHHAASSGG